MPPAKKFKPKKQTEEPEEIRICPELAEQEGADRVDRFATLYSVFCTTPIPLDVR